MFVQLEGDIRQISTEVERLRSELKAGVPRVLEEGGQEAAEPLRMRLSMFLSLAENRLLALQKQLSVLDGTLQKTLGL
jgi:hypothetical protein